MNPYHQYKNNNYIKDFLDSIKDQKSLKNVEMSSKYLDRVRDFSWNELREFKKHGGLTIIKFWLEFFVE